MVTIFRLAFLITLSSFNRSVLASSSASSSNRKRIRNTINQLSKTISSTYNSDSGGGKFAEWHRRKRIFLDKIAVVSETLLKFDNAKIQDEAGDDEEITQQSDLTLPNRQFCIVTTAALPWMTGTAVNPLLRAAYLWKYSNEKQLKDAKSVLDGEEVDRDVDQTVTIILPWLELEEDRKTLYGKNNTFSNESEQEKFIRTWLSDKAGLADAADPVNGIKIIFYPARYHAGLRSIFAMGDIVSYIPDFVSDICILEEPEHLNWYRAPGSGWTKRFKYVVGVVHTNYKEYASGHYSGLWTSPAIGFLSSAMVRAYCHKVIKLSDVLQTYAPEKETTSNVHGVRNEFLEEGNRRAKFSSISSLNKSDHNNEKPVYFIGKILWAKGLDRLLELESFYRQVTGDYFPVDIYGSGPDEKEIKRAFLGRDKMIFVDRKDAEGDEDVGRYNNTTSTFSENGEIKKNQDLPMKVKLAAFSKSIASTTDYIDFPKSLYELRRNPIPANFLGKVDHSLLKAQKVFVNPSLSEVLCTTTAEALAMGKFVVIPVHPSNTFFLKFPNCLAYRNKMEFAANICWSLSHDPTPLTPDLVHEFTWEAATERFIKAAAITKREARYRSRIGSSKIDERIAWLHNEIGKGAKGDVIRKALGGGPVSDQVKYELEKKHLEKVGEEDDTFDDEDDSEGLTWKFRKSSLARAIHSTILGYLSTKE